MHSRYRTFRAALDRPDGAARQAAPLSQKNPTQGRAYPNSGETACHCGTRFHCRAGTQHRQEENARREGRALGRRENVPRTHFQHVLTL